MQENYSELSQQQKEELEKDYSFKAIPTIKYYQTTYANSMGNNDKKAVDIFKEYEPIDKIRRLKTELTAIAQERVDPNICQTTVGPKRKGKFGSYSKWARIVLCMLNTAT